MDETGAREVLANFGPGPHAVDRVMRVYTVTEGASDAPAGLPFGVCEQVIGPGSASPQPGWVHFAATLRDARALVPAVADYRMPRQDGDPAVVVETWL